MNGFHNGPMVRSLLALGCISGAIASLPAAAGEVPDYAITLRQATPDKDGNDVGATRILVDGPTASGYTEVTNDSIDIWAAVTLQKNATVRIEPSVLKVTVEGKVVSAAITYGTQRLKFTLPYADPRSPTVTNQRTSPVAACNSRLAALNGAARAAFLDKGAELIAYHAYGMRAEAAYIKYEQVGEKRQRVDVVDGTATAFADAVIVCRALDRTRPRTSPPTTTGAAPKPGKSLAPTIASVKLRIEPATPTEIGKQFCPTQLKLYGQAEAIRAFKGKAVFFGTGFTSPMVPLSFDGPGNRSVVATYPLTWTGNGGLAIAGPGGLKSQMVSLALNITDQDNRILESVKETVTVACKPMRMGTGNAVGSVIDTKARDAIKASGNPVDAEMWSWHEAVRASEPAAARAQRVGEPLTVEKRMDLGTPLIDAHIRKVDRSGPGGATRLWLRNGGTGRADSCVLAAKHESHKGWIIVDSVQLGAGETIEITAKMPRDPAVEFAVTCPGESEGTLADNIVTLP